MQRTIHPDNWFSASDFTAEGQTFIIDHVELKEIAPAKQKLVVFFKGERKALVLNEVNSKTIEKNTGESDTDKWTGYKITLYSTHIKVNGQPMPCIRIKILIGEFSAKEF